MQYGTFVIGLVKFIDHDPHWYTREVKKVRHGLEPLLKLCFLFFHASFFTQFLRLKSILEDHFLFVIIHVLKESTFQWGVESYSGLIFFRFTSSREKKKENSSNFLNQSESKLKLPVSWSPVFFPHFRQFARFYLEFLFAALNKFSLVYENFSFILKKNRSR